MGCCTKPIQTQRVIQALNADLPPERKMQFRMGVHLGEVLVEGERLFGTGVNVAARIQALAEPGGLCISGKVHDELRNRIDFNFEDLGEQEVKNIPEPVHVFRVNIHAEVAPETASSRKGWGLAAAVVLLLAVAGVAAWRMIPSQESSPVPPVSDIFARPAIAVLPFDNLSGDPEQEYFADGLAEDLITRLSRWQSFPVIARNSSFVYKGRAVDVKQIGEELDARYVVEGSVRRADRRVRINAQLIDALTGHHVWAEQYDRDLKDTLLLQDEITEAIVGAMHPELLRFERRRASRGDPDHLDAWDLVQRGYWHWYRFNREDNATALTLFQRATKLDPGFARAFIGQSRAHDREFQHGWTELPEESLRQSLETAHRAVDLDPTDPLAHRQLGVALAWSGDIRGYRAALRRSIELDPTSADAHILYGSSESALGNVNEAITSIETGLRLSPRDPALQHMGLVILGSAHLRAHRYQEAIEYSRRGIESRPTGGWAQRGTLQLAAAYAHQGRLDEAHTELEKVYQRDPDFSLEEFLAARPEDRRPLSAGHDHLKDGLRKAAAAE